jgi:hypothetical protein
MRQYCLHSNFFQTLTSYSWSAVARGTAAKGLEIQTNTKNVVAARKCRRYYGTSKNPIFVKGKHREFEATISKYDGHKRARRQMDWLLKKGQDLSTSEPAHAKITLSTNFWPGEKRESRLELLASNKEHAPIRSTDEARIPSPSNKCNLLTDPRVCSWSPLCPWISVLCQTKNSKHAGARLAKSTSPFPMISRSQLSLRWNSS